MAFRNISALLQQQYKTYPIGRLTTVHRSNRTLRTSSAAFSGLLRIQDQGGVRRITFDNPKKRNVLSLQMLQELDACFQVCLSASDLRCVVIAGDGPVFSSGHDLKELHRDTGTEMHRDILQLCSKVMLTVRDIPVPVIAQVDGLAAAAGCQLVASCDIVLATANAKFSLPGASFGLFCHTPGIPVSRCVPTKMSAYMLMTGIPISAQEALYSGLVSKVVPANELQEETEKIVEAIRAKSRSVLALGKRFYYRQVQLPIQEAYTAGEEVMLHNLSYRDTQEGISAFKEKRQPKWEHSDEKIRKQ
ncbi:enoyl-CoA hydratase domain-containing protein 3, mitochondrial-like [Ornithodoros turicata]|uniref:enoyl-CoA hydratase domain-containing protein 3, mitochondrial-like n=1 Tax=Ornithodoros turicata TaxID=34597 RepID=UPI0031398FDD